MSECCVPHGQMGICIVLGLSADSKWAHLLMSKLFMCIAHMETDALLYVIWA
jgi:hypothetical protein